MQINQLKPLGDRILVKRVQAATSKGAILLPDAAKEKSLEGEILAVGPGKCDERGKLHPVELEVGQKVLFSAYAGNEMQDEYVILSEEDLLAVVS